MLQQMDDTIDDYITTIFNGLYEISIEISDLKYRNGHNILDDPRLIKVLENKNLLYHFNRKLTLDFLIT
jgi:hypothetical protein